FLSGVMARDAVVLVLPGQRVSHQKAQATMDCGVDPGPVKLLTPCRRRKKDGDDKGSERSHLGTSHPQSSNGGQSSSRPSRSISRSSSSVTPKRRAISRLDSATGISWSCV